MGRTLLAIGGRYSSVREAVLIPATVDKIILTTLLTTGDIPAIAEVKESTVVKDELLRLSVEIHCAFDAATDC